jgi:hypothetical protein
MDAKAQRRKGKEENRSENNKRENYTAAGSKL